jgi:hypothetical protein
MIETTALRHGELSTHLQPRFIGKGFQDIPASCFGIQTIFVNRDDVARSKSKK